MAERDPPRATALPMARPEDRPKVSSRTATRSSSIKFGSLTTSFFRRSEDQDPAMGVRRLLLEKDRTKSLSIARSNLITLGNTVSLAEEQNDLLAEIIKQLKGVRVQGSSDDSSDLDELDSMIDRIRKVKPGRGRYGSAAKKRLARIRAKRRDQSTRLAAKPRVEPQVRVPPQQTPDASRTRPPVDVRRETRRAPTSAAARNSIKQRIIGPVRTRIGRAVLSKVPAAGVVFGLFFGAQRAAAGDYVGAGLEVASGAAGGLLFGFGGTAVSLGLDAAILARDLYSDVYGINIEEDPQSRERLAELTSIIGETVREIAVERPESRIPEYNSESRDRLQELYMLAQEDSALREAIGGDSTMSALAAQLRNSPGRTTAAGFDTALSTIRSRLLRSRSAASPGPTTSNLVDRGRDLSTRDLGEMSSTEFGNIFIEADLVEYEGQIPTASSTRFQTNFMVPAAVRIPSPVARPVSIPSAVPSIPSTSGATAEVRPGQTSDDFMSEVNRVSSKFGINPSDLLALMRSESSLNPQAVNRTTGATGLIQFMPRTARSLGTTTEELRQMTAAQQMIYVEKFFDGVGLPRGASAGQLYAYVFLPGRARREVLTSRGEAFYEANRGLDMDSDGRITIADLDARMARFGGTAQASRMPPPGIGGGTTLASASGGMVAADQARGAGRQVVIQQQISQAARNGRSGAAGRLPRIASGELSLNRRLEQQVS